MNTMLGLLGNFEQVDLLDQIQFYLPLSTTIIEEEGFYVILKEDWLSMVDGILCISEYIVVIIVVVYAEIYLESSIIRFFFPLSPSKICIEYA